MTSENNENEVPNTSTTNPVTVNSEEDKNNVEHASKSAIEQADNDKKTSRPPRPPRPKGAKMTACDRCRKFRRKCVRKNEEEECESCREKKWECVTTYIPLARTNWSKTGSRMKIVKYIFGSERPDDINSAPPSVLSHLVPGTFTYMPYTPLVFQALPFTTFPAPQATLSSPGTAAQPLQLQPQLSSLSPEQIAQLQSGLTPVYHAGGIGLQHQFTYPLGPTFPVTHRAAAVGEGGGRTKRVRSPGDDGKALWEKEILVENERLIQVGQKMDADKVDKWINGLTLFQAQAVGSNSASRSHQVTTQVQAVGPDGVDYRLGVSIREGALSLHLLEECLTFNGTLSAKKLFPNLLQDFENVSWDSSKMGAYGDVIIALCMLRGARHSAHSALLGSIAPYKKPELVGDLRAYGRSRESLCRILIMQTISKTLADPLLTNLQQPSLTNLYILRDVVITFWHLYPEQVEEVFKLEIRTWRELWKKDIAWMEEESKYELRDDICGYLILHDNVISRRLNKLPFLTDGELIAYMTTPTVPGQLFTDPLTVYNLSDHVTNAATAEDLDTINWASTAVILRTCSILNHAFQKSTPSQCLTMLSRLWEIIVERQRWRDSSYTTEKPYDFPEPTDDPRPPFIYYGPMGRESEGSTELNQTEEAEIYFVFLNYIHKLEDRFYAEPEVLNNQNDWASPEPALPNELIRLKNACKEKVNDHIARLALWVGWSRKKSPNRLAFVQWLTPYMYLPGGTGYLSTFIAENPTVNYEFTGETGSEALVQVVIEANKSAGWAGISFGWEVASFEESFKRLSLSDRGSPPEDTVRETREGSQSTQTTSQWQSQYNPFAGLGTSLPSNTSSVPPSVIGTTPILGQNLFTTAQSNTVPITTPVYHQPLQNFYNPAYSLHNYPIPTSINQQQHFFSPVKVEPDTDSLLYRQLVDLNDVSHSTVY